MALIYDKIAVLALTNTKCHHGHGIFLTCLNLHPGREIYDMKQNMVGLTVQFAGPHLPDLQMLLSDDNKISMRCARNRLKCLCSLAM